MQNCLHEEATVSKPLSFPLFKKKKNQPAESTFTTVLSVWNTLRVLGRAVKQPVFASAPVGAAPDAAVPSSL